MDENLKKWLSNQDHHIKSVEMYFICIGVIESDDFLQFR